MRAYQQTCVKVVQRFDGRIAQLLGDALLVYFGWPQAHEDDARRAVHAGLGMLEAMGTLNTRLEQEKGLSGAHQAACRRYRAPAPQPRRRLFRHQPVRTGRQSPVTVLTQNVHAAAFFVRLADLSRDLAYRKTASWALSSFPNSHRTYEAFAAGFGHALGRLLAPPLLITITGVPGAPEVRSLAYAALTQLRHGDLVLQFRQDRANQAASAHVHIDDRLVGPITDPAVLRPELPAMLNRT